MGVGQLVVGPVFYGVDRIVASAGGGSACVVLAGDAARMDWTEFGQLPFDVLDFQLQAFELGIFFHDRYYITDIGKNQTQRSC